MDLNTKKLGLATAAVLAVNSAKAGDGSGGGGPIKGHAADGNWNQVIQPAEPLKDTFENDPKNFTKYKPAIFYNASGDKFSVAPGFMIAGGVITASLGSLSGPKTRRKFIKIGTFGTLAGLILTGAQSCRQNDLNPIIEPDENNPKDINHYLKEENPVTIEPLTYDASQYQHEKSETYPPDGVVDGFVSNSSEKWNLNRTKVKIEFNNPIEIKNYDPANPLNSIKYVNFVSPMDNYLKNNGKVYPAFMVENLKVEENGTTLSFVVNAPVTKGAKFNIGNNVINVLETDPGTNEVKPIKLKMDHTINITDKISDDDLATKVLTPGQGILVGREFKPENISLLRPESYNGAPNNIVAPGTEEGTESAIRADLEGYLNKRADAGLLGNYTVADLLQDFDQESSKVVVPSPKLRAALIAHAGGLGDAIYQHVFKEPYGQTKPITSIKFEDPQNGLSAKSSHTPTSWTIKIAPNQKSADFRELKSLLFHEFLHDDIDDVPGTARQEEKIISYLESLDHLNEIAFSREYENVKGNSAWYKQPHVTNLTENSMLLLMFNSGKFNHDGSFYSENTLGQPSLPNPGFFHADGVQKVLPDSVNGIYESKFNNKSFDDFMENQLLPSVTTPGETPGGALLCDVIKRATGNMVNTSQVGFNQQTAKWLDTFTFVKPENLKSAWQGLEFKSSYIA